MTSTRTTDLNLIAKRLDNLGTNMAGMQSIMYALSMGAEFHPTADKLLVETKTGDAFAFLSWAMDLMLTESAACIEDLSNAASEMEEAQ